MGLSKPVFLSLTSLTLKYLASVLSVLCKFLIVVLTSSSKNSSYLFYDSMLLVYDFSFLLILYLFFFLFFLYYWQGIYIMISISTYHDLILHFHNYWKANWRQLSKWHASLIYTTQINTTCGTYVLQSLQGHSDGIPFFLFLLKISRNSESFMSFGKMSHIFGVK